MKEIHFSFKAEASGSVQIGAGRKGSLWSMYHQLLIVLKYSHTLQGTHYLEPHNAWI